MAKQNGILPIKGKIGNLSFYKSRDGHLVREKGGIDANRMASDPAFQRTRENQSEFARAGSAAKLLRNAVRVVSKSASDRRQFSRLATRMSEVVKSDLVSDRGQRNVIDGNIGLLHRFEFNIAAVLESTFFAPFTAAIDRVTDNLSIEIPAFVPEKSISKPEGASHFQVISAGTAVDFEGNAYETATASSATLPFDNEVTDAITLSNAVTANSTNPLFLLLGIQFFQEVNGKM